jgi:hypothetical protein
MATCGGCGSEIVWLPAIKADGRRGVVPVEAEEVPVVVTPRVSTADGDVLVRGYTRDGRLVSGRRARPGDLGAVFVRESHYAYCSRAADFRRPRRGGDAA